MRRGFTLAEVLITLGIIGVVAAITIPSVKLKSVQAKIGPSLSRFVSTFENAIKTMDENEDIALSQTVSTDVASVSPILATLDKYILWVEPDAATSNAYQIYLADGRTAYADAGKGADYDFRILKDGSIALFYKKETPSAGNKLTRVFYDLNGFAGPNAVSKDVYAFDFMNDGTLLPYGSSRYVETYGLTASDYVCNTTKANFTSNASCTGKVADEGWKAKY